VTPNACSDPGPMLWYVVVQPCGKVMEPVWVRDADEALRLAGDDPSTPNLYHPDPEQGDGWFLVRDWTACGAAVQARQLARGDHPDQLEADFRRDLILCGVAACGPLT
jgi:hypothetical protein